VKPVIVIWILGIVAGLVWGAILCLFLSSYVFAIGTGFPYHLSLWLDAALCCWPGRDAALWRLNWWIGVWIALGAATPAVMLFMVAKVAVSAFRSRWAIQGRFMMLTKPPLQPWSPKPPAMTHGDAAFAQGDDAAEELRR
jgi:hypothetical protein